MRRVMSLFLFLTLGCFGSSEGYCNNRLNTLNITPELKSVKGWKRVCNKDSLQDYTDFKLNTSLKREACECLTSKIDIVRNIEYTKTNIESLRKEVNK